MKEKSRFFYAIFLISATAILLYSCASVPKVVTNYYLNPNKNSSVVIDRDGLSIEVKPITMENYKKFPKIFTPSYSYREIKSGDQLMGGDFLLLSPPAFELTITNTTGHTIAFSKASIKLQDDAGERYDVSMKSDILDELDNYQSTFTAAGYSFDLIPIKTKIKTLKIIDRNFEILHGTTEKGYLTFNLGIQKPRDYENFLVAKNYLKVMLYELPIKTDEAGNITKTTNFDFIFDVSAKTDTLK